MRVFLFAIVVFGLVCGVCVAQSQQDFKDILDAAEREFEFNDRQKKAVAAGQAMFGVHPGMTVEKAHEYRGKLSQLNPPEFKVGDWGYTRHIFRTLDIVSEKEMLVMPIWKESPVMLIRGLDTTKVTDGVEIILQYPFVIEETYSYETVGGNQVTTLVLDTTKADKRVEDQRAAAEAALVREWTINEAQISAKFIDCQKNEVTLTRQDDASEIKMPISELNKADQKWVRDEMKKRREIEAEKQARARSVKKKR